jgi:hypothetical protein
VAIALACFLPALSAFQRINTGAHFLSDTILAVLFTLLVAHWVAGALTPKAR